MKAILVVGLGFGDEGKGSIVDSLVRKTGAGLVVRFNGGAQAAHNVVLSDGCEHCFAQFGSGTLVGAKTHLSRFMMIDPVALQNEARHLELIGVSRPFESLTIDPLAPIITPYHRVMNQLRELSRGDQAHGSCGIGIGELKSDIVHDRDFLTAGDLWIMGPIQDFLERTQMIRERFLQEVSTFSLPDTDEVRILVNSLKKSLLTWLERIWSIPVVLAAKTPYAETTIYEGAQGVLLDEKYGYEPPHVTWSNCLFDNAHTLLDEMHFKGEMTKIGVIRSYMTRHGYGPFPTEGHLNIDMSKEHNKRGKWQGDFRVGCFDSTLVHYASAVVGGLDVIALTHLDQFRAPWPIRIEHDLRYVRRSGELITLIEETCHAPVKIMSCGPTEKDKTYEF